MKKTLFILLIANLIFSFWLYNQPSHDSFFNYFYNLSYATNFLLAFFFCLSHARTENQHKGIYFLLGFGSLFFAIAQGIWFYYNLSLQSNTPYPSPADGFFLAFYIFVIATGIYCMKKMGIIFNFQRILEIVVSTLVIFMIIYSYISSFNDMSNETAATHTLDLIYPFFDTVLTTLTLSALRSQIGKLRPQLLYFMFAFLILTFGDTLFAYQTKVNHYWNGNIADALFALSGFFFAMGVIDFPKLLTPSSTTLNNKLL